ncbi:response regulator [Caballeronia pedi]|nr:response regulator [Caballeronia pedi]
MAADTEPTRLTEAKVEGGTETILVVEDDPQVQSTAVEILTELGYRVLKADDAEGALTILRSGLPIDLLFTDVVMPGKIRSPELARQAQRLLPKLQCCSPPATRRTRSSMADGWMQASNCWLSPMDGATWRARSGICSTATSREASRRFRRPPRRANGYWWSKISKIHST